MGFTIYLGNRKDIEVHTDSLVLWCTLLAEPWADMDKLVLIGNFHEYLKTDPLVEPLTSQEPPKNVISTEPSQDARHRPGTLHQPLEHIQSQSNCMQYLTAIQVQRP